MRQKTVLLPLALAAGLALAGCSGTSPTAAGTPPAAPSATPSPTPSATAGAAASATPGDAPAAETADEPEPAASAAPAPVAETTPAPAPVAEAAPAPPPVAEAAPAPAPGAGLAPEAAPAPVPVQPEQAAPADPLTAFTTTPEGGRWAGTVTGVTQQPGPAGGVVAHRIVADTNDRAVAVEVCRAYQSSMGTGPAHIDVVDTAGRPLAATAGDPPSCQVTTPPDVGAVPFPGKFSYDEALAAWRGGMPYYDAFCVNYDPVTEAGLAQCTGIENGTVDSVTGEYIGG